MMKLREDMKPTDGQTELQPLQQKDDPQEENESLEPPSTPQTININNEDIVDPTPTTTTTSPERDTTSNQESNGTPERKSRPQFKVSQMRNRATRSGTVPTRYTEHRSESCSPKRNVTIEGFLRKGERPPSVTPPKENGSSRPKLAAKAAEDSERPLRTVSKSRADQHEPP